ncbi:T9SS type A sorting domain-containing protein [Parvicella tangerina]|uniref:Secretion system C-terminal sorting domain-containing protein n=1 Tax=Parvicella tangerina TaxID=2829795 RepID=A0A916JNE1_9FLAO|nr:T9SS type A sorting domain-containing protein [Parvicella tangerina]CAG5083522.1 hypothetical protein CRYO30217_02221 [Parvicella tangerina]
MKKISTLLLVCAIGTAQAQITDTYEVWFNDTVAYIDAKTSSYSGIGINQTNAGGGYGYAGYAQLFEAPDTVNIEGVCFYGVMDSGSNFSAAVKMYDGSSGSPGAVIAATTHVIPYFGSGYTGAMNDPSILQCAMFTTPVQWEGDYFLGIENFTSSDMYIARSADGDGAGEGLSYTYYKGVSDPSFDGWYDMFSFGAGWDFDLIIRPVVSYRSQSMVTYDTTVCLGDTFRLAFEYHLDDSLMHNKFYNPNYATYNGYSVSHQFDYGDMTGLTSDTFHLYTGGGFKGVEHMFSATVSSWGTTSFDSTCSRVVEVVDPYFDIADQSSCSGDSVYFVADQGYDSYLWNDLSSNDSLLIETSGMSNGDYTYYVDYELNGCFSSDTMTLSIGDLLVNLGGDTTLCLNQEVVLTAGVYDGYNWNTGQTTETIQVGPFISPGSEEIILTATQGNCSGADTVLITVDNCLGVESLQSNEVDLYPNPSNGYFHVKSTSRIKTVDVIALSGKVVKTVIMSDQHILDITDVADGVYLLEMETEAGMLYKKVRVIRWNSW